MFSFSAGGNLLVIYIYIILAHDLTWARPPFAWNLLKVNINYISIRVLVEKHVNADYYADLVQQHQRNYPKSLLVFGRELWRPDSGHMNLGKTRPVDELPRFRASHHMSIQCAQT